MNTSEDLETETIDASPVLRASWREYLALSKLRLTLLVVLTACLGYFIAIVKTSAVFHLGSFLGLVIGGFLLTASSNTLNQIIERQSDSKMSRTANRPLVMQRISFIEALLFALISGVSSLIILGLSLNATAAFLGLASLILYAFFYTPLKKLTPLAVFVGAFPGAFPPLLGFIGATGVMTFDALVLFTIQFFWQFPHFWSLAWVLHDDYQKAGYFMLPSKTGKSKKSAFQIWWYSVMLLIVSFIPIYSKLLNTQFSVILYFSVAILLGAFMIGLSRKLYNSLSDADARKLMFASFVYIPLLLAALLF
jgi:protoheme IX farnesyltransferase